MYAIQAKYEALQSAGFDLSAALSDLTDEGSGQSQLFEGGALYNKDGAVAQLVYSTILEQYRQPPTSELSLTKHS